MNDLIVEHRYKRFADVWLKITDLCQKLRSLEQAQRWLLSGAQMHQDDVEDVFIVGRLRRFLAKSRWLEEMGQTHTQALVEVIVCYTQSEIRVFFKFSYRHLHKFFDHAFIESYTLRFLHLILSIKVEHFQ